MTTIHAQLMGDKALVTRADLEQLVALAGGPEQIDLHLHEDDVPSAAWTQFLQSAGAFDFWHDQGEDIYTAKDGEPL